ncbi:craniofacial development protein 1 [Epargyreus clarus]|uniref:craniofacial development protein 1 n=1 Tax=Epargyreus clarus TaxID=520877 RepID=UPI003C308E22
MSSGSESDDEYVPEEPEKVSEEESADDETDLQYEKEQEQRKSQKRKPTQSRKGKKKMRPSNANNDIDEEEKESTEAVANPEEDKKREEDLWAKFLEGTDTKPKSTTQNTTPSQTTAVTPSKAVTATKNDTSKIDDNKEREKRIFEFAGETIVVENDVIKEKIKSTDSSSATKEVGPSRSRGAGLSNVLEQLNKKNKLSTLEKSKLDWVTYKKEEGIEEEIHSHNKGKDGYLERQDFLERADLRQYEIERDLRMKRRSNR